MKLRITANYPPKLVEDIVKRAYEFVYRNKTIEPPPDYPIWVKGSKRHAHAGTFWYSKITLRIGSENRFPHKFKYPRLETAPEYTLNDWQEALFSLAVHELWHWYQYKTGSGFSEIETERQCVVALEEFRKNRSDLDNRERQRRDKVQQRDQDKESRQRFKKTPQYELEKIKIKISKYQRRMKLAQNKLKKLIRRQNHLQKKICLNQTK